MTSDPRAQLALTSGFAALVPRAAATLSDFPFVERMASTARTTARISRWLEADQQLPKLDGSEKNLRLAADPERLWSVSLAAGALWRGNDVAAVVRRDERAKIIDTIGMSGRTFVLRHRAEIPPAPPLLTDLMAQIERCAAICRRSWGTSLPPGLARRVTLMMDGTFDVSDDADYPAQTGLRLFQLAQNWFEDGPMS